MNDEKAEMKSWWSSLCDQQLLQIKLLAKPCSEIFRGMMNQVGKKLTDLSPPKKREEQDRRTRQASLVSIIVQCISEASAFSKKHPNVEIELSAAAMKLADNDLPGTMDGFRLISSRCSEFSRTLRAICEKAK